MLHVSLLNYTNKKIKMIYPGAFSLTLGESKEARLSFVEMDDNFKFLNNLADLGGSGTSGSSVNVAVEIRIYN